jgi:hypothetical protein
MSEPQMQIFYDSEKTKEIQQRMIDYWEKTKQERGTELHAYDIANCEMKAFCRLTGLKPVWTNQIAGMMIFGIIGGLTIQMTYPEDQREWAGDLEKLVFCHIDVFENKEVPLEVKTTRKRLFRKDTIPDAWINQILTYMVITKKRKGHLVFFNALSTAISVWTIVISEEGLQCFQLYILEKANRIKECATSGNYTPLKVSPEQYSGCSYKKDCAKRDECKKAYAELKKAGKVDDDK